MNKKIIVRRATQYDVEQLLELNFEFNGCNINEAEAMNCLIHSNELVAIALMDDEPVGFACAQYYKSFCYPDLYGEITEMYVRQAARRSGVASLLLSFIEAELQLIGITNLKIVTGLENEVAIKVYEKNGYNKKDYQVLNKKLMK